ncbi:hypothetical protein [Erwinia amylovora]|uniref:hypothetical protein n=1 Tax=Erwinia amylovora TaxID=552 RepID=UPI000C077D0A|nr:hypothetical protein [Erwinia amylovora]
MTINLSIKNFAMAQIRKVTGGNISTAEFDGLLGKISDAKNLSANMLRAVNKKAEKHLILKTKVAVAYYSKAVKLYGDGIEGQGKILEAQQSVCNEFEKNERAISKNILKNSDPWFRLKVSSTLQDVGMDFLSISKAYGKLYNAEHDLNAAKESHHELTTKIQREIEKLRKPGRYSEQDIASNISRRFGESEKKVLNTIENKTTEVEKCWNEYLESKKIQTKAIIDAAEENPQLVSEYMEPFIQKYKILVSEYNSAPNTMACIEKNIKILKIKQKEVTSQKDELKKFIRLMTAHEVLKYANTLLEEKHNKNKEPSEEISNTLKKEIQTGNEINHAIAKSNKVIKNIPAVKDAVIQLPDAPTHTPTLTQPIREKYSPVAG